MQVYVKPNTIYVVQMPYSEVMMHMRMANKFKYIALTDHNMVRVFKDKQYTDECGAVTPGEAGLYFDENVKQYYFNKE